MTHEQLLALGFHADRTPKCYALDRSRVSEFAGFTGIPMLTLPGFNPSPGYSEPPTPNGWTVWYAPQVCVSFETEAEFDAYILAARLQA